MREGFSTVILLKNGILPKIGRIKNNAKNAIFTQEINKKIAGLKLNKEFFSTILTMIKLFLGRKLGHFRDSVDFGKTTIMTLHKIYNKYNNMV